MVCLMISAVTDNIIHHFVMRGPATHLHLCRINP